jgi:hypothetical protein
MLLAHPDHLACAFFRQHGSAAVALVCAGAEYWERHFRTMIGTAVRLILS